MSTAATGVSPLDVEDLRTRVAKTLGDFLDAQVPLLDEISDELSAITEALTDLLAGGKRLRPAFCYWGWRGAGGADTDAIVQAATALELLQACALIHDDVMDGSDTRRGLPAAHRRLAALHRGNGWLGSSEDFGIGGAILLGDLCLSWSDQLFAAADLPTEAKNRARGVYDVMRTELMAGQYLDLLAQAVGEASTERARQVIRYKSAKYTIERPLHLGAALAGADDAVVAAYSAYGLPLGEAFQLRDDVLGVFGDPSTTGKPAGDDLREGKRTVLIAETLERADPSQAALIRRHLGDPALSSDGVDAIREIIDGSGALASVEALISAQTERALAALAGVDLDPVAAGVLADLAVAATARKV